MQGLSSARAFVKESGLVAEMAGACEGWFSCQKPRKPRNSPGYFDVLTGMPDILSRRLKDWRQTSKVATLEASDMCLRPGILKNNCFEPK